MKTTGIIVEYNPFHKGHKYHLEIAKKQTKSDYIIAVMSGHFTQRGTPAICDKWKRAQMAINSGVDLLIELPLIYSLRSAEYFAEGSMCLLNSLNLINNLVFGSEHGNIEPLRKIARILQSNNAYYNQRLKYYLSNGIVFPAARKNALLDLIKLDKNEKKWSNINLFEILNGSNNILGIEYLKAKYKHNMNFNIGTIKRIGGNYFSNDINSKMISATAIRKSIYNNNFKNIKEKIPAITYKILLDEIQKNKIPIDYENLGILIISKIRSLNIKELKKYHDINENLAIRIKKAAEISGNYKQLILNLNTRAYTKTRFQRILLNILFDLTQEIVRNYNTLGPSYIRILGFSQKGEKLLPLLKQKTKLPIIFNPKDYLNEIDLASENPLIKSLSYDIYSTDIYTMLYRNHNCRLSNLDFTRNIVKNN